MANVDNNPMETEKQGRGTGLISGFILGVFLFWLTIQVVKMVSA